MKNYHVALEEVSLKEAVELMEGTPSLTVFYTYGIGKPIHLLDRESLSTAINGNAIYLSPSSFVETELINLARLENEEQEKLKNMSVAELAQLLQYGLVDGCWLSDDENVYDFIKKYVL